MTTFKRTYAYPGTYDKGIKAAKVLGFSAVTITAIGAWRSLNPVNGEYLDFEGPFTVKKGVDPAFVRHDGVEVFMLNDTSMVEVEFEET